MRRLDLFKANVHPHERKSEGVRKSSSTTLIDCDAWSETLSFLCNWKEGGAGAYRFIHSERVCRSDGGAFPV
jgi:hypothetical protein